MSLTIKVKTDFAAARALLEGFSERRIRSSIATALTRTAKAAQKDVIESIGALDRPTAYARGATRVIPADINRMAASVWLKDRQSKVVSKASHFLYPQVFAGRRDRKAYETALLSAGVLRSNEFTVPADGFPLDSYGNVPLGVIRQMLSQLRAAEISSGYTSNRSNSARSRRAVKKAGSFFVPVPGGSLPRGIYRRTNGQVQMVLKIVVGKPSYRTRVPMFDIGRKAVNKHFETEFERAIAQSRARLQARG